MAQIPVPGLVKQAVSAGVVHPTAVLDGGLSMLDESRTNQVHALHVDGAPVAYAKQRGWASVVDGDDPVANERHALTLLARSGLVPQMLPIDSPDVLWTESLHPCTVLYRLLSDAPRGKVITAVRAWGQAMASLHRWSTRFGSPPVSSVPWIVEPTRVPAHLADVSADSEVARVLAELRGNPGIRSAMDAVADSWTARHWIHGDANTANAVARPAGPYRWRVWFVDLETAGLGCPSWDLATAYDSLEFHGLTRGTDMRAFLGALLDGYRSGSGPARLTRGMLTTRAALTAVQVAASIDQGTPNLKGTGAAPFLRRAAALAALDPAPVTPRQAYLPEKSRPLGVSA
jgi:hypothetical protein